jgi:anti-sigma-K factor RskA
MNDKLHIADTDLALFAMGALSAAEMEAIQGHLEACSTCKEEVRQNTLALGVYAQTTPETALPSGAKERFLTKLANTPQVEESSRRIQPAQVITTRESFWRNVFGPGAFPWSAAFAGALVVALMMVGFDDLHKRAEMAPLIRRAQRGAMDSAQLAQLMDLLTSPQAKKVALHQGAPATPPPEGRVVYSAQTGKLLLTASNLHALPAGKVYELWILQPGGKKPLPSGTFTPDTNGYATMILADAPPGLAVQGFGVTVENAGGSETPTLPIVLSGL